MEQTNETLNFLQDDFNTDLSIYLDKHGKLSEAAPYMVKYFYHMSLLTFQRELIIRIMEYMDSHKKIEVSIKEILNQISIVTEEYNRSSAEALLEMAEQDIAYAKSKVKELEEIKETLSDD